MNKPLYNPFTDTDLDNINECIGACAQLDDFLARCERCDISMAEAREQLTKLTAFYTKIKGEFFPDRP